MCFPRRAVTTPPLDQLLTPSVVPQRGMERPVRSIDELAAAIRAEWAADTAWIDDWSADNAPRGQCGSSSIVLQDHRGGELMSALVQEAPGDLTVHYWNVLDLGQVDLTWHQFARSARIVQAKVVTREDLLTTAWLTNRYEKLAARVVDRLASTDALAG